MGIDYSECTLITAPATDSRPLCILPVALIHDSIT